MFLFRPDWRLYFAQREYVGPLIYQVQGLFLIETQWDVAEEDHALDRFRENLSSLLLFQTTSCILETLLLFPGVPFHVAHNSHLLTAFLHYQKECTCRPALRGEPCFVCLYKEYLAQGKCSQALSYCLHCPVRCLFTCLLLDRSRKLLVDIWLLCE